VAGVPVVALHALRDVGVFPSWAWIWKKYRDEGREEVLAERLAGWQEKLPRRAGASTPGLLRTGAVVGRYSLRTPNWWWCEVMAAGCVWARSVPRSRSPHTRR
jgi:hypothetical protein